MKLTATISLLLFSLLSFTVNAQQDSKSFTNSPSQNIYPLKSLKTGHSTTDLQWLKAVLKDVKYVGLGEAIYGSKETFEVKHRLLEFLVKEMGYTTLAIEASYSGCRNINDYVVNDIGDSHSALASVGKWNLQNKDMLELIEWLHNYNKTVPGNKKIKFYGFDIQVNSASGGVAKLKNYLKKVDAAVETSNKGVFADFTRIENGWKGDTAAERKEELFHVLQQLQIHKNEYIAASSVLEYQDALQYATVMMQYLDAQLMTDADPRKKDREWRDFYMASNFDYLIQQDTNAKVVIWAQNVHLNKDSAASVNYSKEPFGSYLKEAYPNQYYAIGIYINKGSLQVMKGDSNEKSKLKKIKIPAPKPGSLEWHLFKENHHNYIVNLKETKTTEKIPVWANTTLEARSIDPVISSGPADNFYSASVNPLKDFDALLFIRSSRPTKQVQSTRK